MQPYQKASEAILNQSKEPGNVLSGLAKAGTTAAGVVGGGAILKRALPFLNQYISPDLAAKGLKKIDTRFGKFIDNALKNGNSEAEAIEYIKDKIQPKQEPAKENRSIIQQYSDQLDTFIKNHIQQGRQPLEAGALAQLDPKFKKVISQIEKDHKTPFSAILESTYGSAQQPQQTGTQSQQQPAQSQQNTDQALMAALEKILQM